MRFEQARLRACVGRLHRSRIDTYRELRGLSVRLEPVRTLTTIPLRNRLMAWGYKHTHETWTLPYIRNADEGRESLAVKRQNPRPQNNLRPRVIGSYRKAPRGGLYSNQGLVELGAYQVNKLRRQSAVVCYPWDSISRVLEPAVKPKGPRYDRMALALQYQSLIDSGTVKTRAELARHIGVSRARVTQVLKRLSECDCQSRDDRR